MGSFDGIAMVAFLFFLSILGWSAEFFLYIGNEIVSGTGGTNSSYIQAQLYETLNIMIIFLRSSYLYLVIALLIVNILLQSGTKLNPIWFGISVLVFFIIIYFLENYIMGPLILGLSGLEIDGYVHTDWFEMINDLWLPSLIGVLIGTLFAYAKGTRSSGGYGISF